MRPWAVMLLLPACSPAVAPLLLEEIILVTKIIENVTEAAGTSVEKGHITENEACSYGAFAQIAGVFIDRALIHYLHGEEGDAQTHLDAAHAAVRGDHPEAREHAENTC